MANFLVLVRPQPGQNAQPHQPGRRGQFVKNYQQAKNWGQQKKQQGRTQQIFAVPQSASGIVGAAIVQADTVDQVVADTHTFPGAAFFQFEVLPLLDFNQTMDSITNQIPQQLP